MDQNKCYSVYRANNVYNFYMQVFAEEDIKGLFVPEIRFSLIAGCSLASLCQINRHTVPVGILTRTKISLICIF